jgi:hypothetical protein
MDVESFKSYCKKYRIPATKQKQILDAMEQRKPAFEQGKPEYTWQKEGKWGYKFECQGKMIAIELGNWPTLNNVTFIGMEGVNI